MRARMLVLVGVAAVALPGCKKGECPYLDSPATHYGTTKSLECNEATEGDCLKKAEQAAQAQGNDAAITKACWHSRRAAKIESRIEKKSGQRRARLVNRAARHRDAEAELLRAAGKGAAQAANEEVDNPAPAESRDEQPEEETLVRRVLLTRHAHAKHELQPQDD